MSALFNGAFLTFVDEHKISINKNNFLYRVERADFSCGGGLGHAPVKNDLSPPSPHSYPPIGLVVNPHS